MRHILALLDSKESVAQDPIRDLKKVASVEIRTKTFASSLFQLVCPGDLSHQLKLTLETLQSINLNFGEE